MVVGQCTQVGAFLCRVTVNAALELYWVLSTMLKVDNVQRILGKMNMVHFHFSRLCRTKPIENARETNKTTLTLTTYKPKC
jgi:hypothetical protein